MSVQTRPLPSSNLTPFSRAVAKSDSGARIAYFSESILPWVDGVSRTLGQVFDALEAEGRDFRVYAPIAPSPEYAWSRHVRFLRSRPLPFHRDYRISTPDKRELQLELDDFRPDLIHVCNPTPAAIWAQSYARSRGIPVVGSLHTHFAAYFRYYHAGLLSGPAWRFLRWFFNRCDLTFAPSRSTVEEMERHGIRNGRIWSRGIDASRFTPMLRDDELRRDCGADDVTPVLLMVSRLVKEKDLADLVKMDRLLKKRDVAYRFALVGKGSFEGELKRKLPDAIFPGQQVGRELSRWYASADIFVFPSTTEAFGNVVQEAMASELATVVVDSGGPPGIVTDGISGLVARPNDPVDLADKVERLISDVELRRSLAAAARREMLDRTWDRINARLLSDYDEVIEMHRKPAAQLNGLRQATV